MSVPVELLSSSAMWYKKMATIEWTSEIRIQVSSSLYSHKCAKNGHKPSIPPPYPQQQGWSCHSSCSWVLRAMHCRWSPRIMDPINVFVNTQCYTISWNCWMCRRKHFYCGIHQKVIVWIWTHATCRWEDRLFLAYFLILVVEVSGNYQLGKQALRTILHKQSG